jgi:predicted amidophosphoribosyltransferase
MQILNVLVPSKCQLCQKSGWSICESCRAGLSYEPVVTTRGFAEVTGALHGVRLFEYQEPISQLIHSFKENGVTELAERLIENVDPEVFSNQAARAFGHESITRLLLVPVPSSVEAFRQRGFAPGEVVAKSFGKLFQRIGLNVSVVRLLKRSRSVRDQSQLSTEERWQNQFESIIARHSINEDVVLVDDISTTGATLLEAKRAVEAAGGRVLGFCALAETLLKQQPISAKPNT